MTKTLIEKLKEIRSRYHNEVVIAEDIIDDCIDIVKEHSDWVACSERLPQENKIVLFYAISAKNVLPDHWDIGDRFKVERTYYNSNVAEVFWQPLPQPPSEVKSET